MDPKSQIDNSIYDRLGRDWYEADDDPVALLRAESKVKTPWILARLAPESKVLDVGCGAGFLSNALATKGHTMTGIDVSRESLRVAALYDATKAVTYLEADAYDLPFPDATFDAVTAMDFLEHVEDPERAIAEMSRVLKPGGLFFFHTFNKNVLAWLVVIKLVEWLLPKTPKNMHLLRLFIKPRDLEHFCRRQGLAVEEMVGIRPMLSTIPWTRLFSGRVPPELRFTLTSNTLLSYMGRAQKI
jgi:2-polyprenyl-6-hydroxyphenyl methylase/3-demethylubiquinone-9 3-methyltransferase